MLFLNIGLRIYFLGFFSLLSASNNLQDRLNLRSIPEYLQKILAKAMEIIWRSLQALNKKGNNTFMLS